MIGASEVFHGSGVFPLTGSRGPFVFCTDLICSGRPSFHRHGAFGASDAPGIGTSWGQGVRGWMKNWGLEVAHHSVGVAPLSHTKHTNTFLVKSRICWTHPLCWCQEKSP